MPSATFRFGVFHVVCSSAYEYMIRSYASTIITSVTQLLAGTCDWSVVNDEGSAMGWNQSSLILNFAVPRSLQARPPNPAFSKMRHVLWSRTSLIHFWPKVFSKSFSVNATQHLLPLSRSHQTSLREALHRLLPLSRYRPHASWQFHVA